MDLWEVQKKKKNEGKLQNYRPELASKNFFDQTTTNESLRNARSASGNKWARVSSHKAGGAKKRITSGRWIKGGAGGGGANGLSPLQKRGVFLGVSAMIEPLWTLLSTDVLV